MNFSRSSLDANENRCVESKMIGVLPPEEDAEGTASLQTEGETPNAAVRLELRKMWRISRVHFRKNGEFVSHKYL